MPSCCTEILWNNSGCVFVVLQERLEINIVIFLMASLKTWTVVTVYTFTLHSNCNPFFLFVFVDFISWFPASRKNRTTISYTCLLCFRQLSYYSEVKYISENWLPSVGTKYLHSPERKLWGSFCLLQPSDSPFHHFPSESKKDGPFLPNKEVKSGSDPSNACADWLKRVIDKHCCEWLHLHAAGQVMNEYTFSCFGFCFESFYGIIVGKIPL